MGLYISDNFLSFQWFVRTKNSSHRIWGWGREEERCGGLRSTAARGGLGTGGREGEQQRRWGSRWWHWGRENEGRRAGIDQACAQHLSEWNKGVEMYPGSIPGVSGIIFFFLKNRKISNTDRIHIWMHRGCIRIRYWYANFVKYPHNVAYGGVSAIK